MCRVLDVNRSGFYAWLKDPKSERQKEDEKLLEKIKQYWNRSDGVYGYRNITLDLREEGELVGKNRIHRLMKDAGIRSERGYKRRPSFKKGKVSHVAANILSREFKVAEPNKNWVTDFTYIRTQEGWLYLTVVIDLFHRQVVGWSMKNNSRADLVIDALTMALQRRKPKDRVVVHSDQGTQYTSERWIGFLRENNLEASMSRRGNCYDNAVAESFFSNLKRERIRRKIYKTREEAKLDIFNYIECFYNPIRRHSANGGLSPVAYEKQYLERYKVSSKVGS